MDGLHDFDSSSTNDIFVVKFFSLYYDFRIFVVLTTQKSVSVCDSQQFYLLIRYTGVLRPHGLYCVVENKQRLFCFTEVFQIKKRIESVIVFGWIETSN